MKILIALGLLLSSFCTAYATPGGDGRFTKDPPKIVRYGIENDRGGEVDKYKSSLQMIKNSGNGLKITGYCASACTMALSSAYNLDICIVEGSSLLIHKPYKMKSVLPVPLIARELDIIYEAEQIYLRDFYNKWPVWLKTEVDSRGGAPSVYTGSEPADMMVIGFETLRKYMVICNA